MTRNLAFSKILSSFLFIFFIILLINYKTKVNCVISKEKTKTCKDVNCTGVFFSTKVIRNYKSTHPNFSNLKMGDTIDVVAIKFSHRGDIMEGIVNGERGYFYTNFVDKDPYHSFLINITATDENILSVVSFSEDKIDFLDSDLHVAFNPNGVYVPKKSKEDDSGHGHSHGGHGHSHGGHGHSHEETSHNHGHIHEEKIITTTVVPSVEKKIEANKDVPSMNTVTNDLTTTTPSPNVEDQKLTLQNDIIISSSVPPPINVPNQDFNNNIINENPTFENINNKNEIFKDNVENEKIVTNINDMHGNLDKIKSEIIQEAFASITADTEPQILNSETVTPTPIDAGVNLPSTDNSGATVPPPVVAASTTLAPTISVVTTPAPTISAVTTPAPTISAVTTPAPTISAVTTPAPTISAVTTPAPTISAVTTPAPTISTVTTPSPTISEISKPIVEEVTTQSTVFVENSMPSIPHEHVTPPVPNIDEIVSPPPIVVDTTTAAPMVNEQTVTPSSIESISLPPLGDLLTVPSLRESPPLNKADIPIKGEGETVPSSMSVDSSANETFETKENISQEGVIYDNNKTKEIEEEKSFLQLYIGYYLKLAVSSFRETLPEPLSKVDDSGIILLILAPISIIIHLTNKFLLSDDGSQEVFERKYLHDSLTKIKEQEVMINKLKETQADPQLMKQFQGLKEEYERIYRENQELLKVKESLSYENNNFKKMFERKENENITLKDELKVIKDKLHSKDESITSLEMKSSKLQSDNNNLSKENNELKDILDEKNKKIIEYSKECEKNIEENKNLKHQIIDIEEQLKNGKDEHDKLRKEIEGLSELLEEMNQNSQNQDNEGAGSIGSTGWSDVGDVEIESAGSNSLGCNKTVKRRSPDLSGGNLLDLARSRAEIKRLEQEIENITVKLTKETVEKDSLLNRISLLEHEIDAQKNELTHNAVERNENSAQISRLLTLVEERSNEIKDLQSREKQLRNEYVELDQKYRDLRDEKLGVEFKCKESESLVKSLQSEVNKLETINYNEVRKLKNQLKLLEEEKNSEIKEFAGGNSSRQSIGLSEGLPITATNPLMNSSGPIRPLWSDVDDAPVASSTMRNQASLFGSELDSSDNGSLKKNVKIRKSMKKSKPPLHEGMLNMSYNNYGIPPPHLEYASSSGRRSVGREMLHGGSQTLHNGGTRRTRSRSQGREGERLVSPLTFTGYDFPEYQQHSFHHPQPSNQRQK
ncbi:SH3 domain and Variant SH3 domain-containing protein [Strongyloides ratti]|uniref:SH3 domain and Variant SH3 domain-containing protein n=1 Tax=Strongyloides ratti TaxID=34506 RepID=A0A090L5M1_STRRB|nr:SH3 domain and Variant SH3 domain-containing protein [Strongyloides ratti]CEF62769.1 SH3 domain and Variant SH3 domain-containing protein [Strongyloides ratti]